MAGSKVHRRRSSRGITHTVIEPGWLKSWKALVRSAKREALYILAAIGGAWVIWHVALWLGTSLGGG